MCPVHAGNLVGNSRNITYRINCIEHVYFIGKSCVCDEIRRLLFHPRLYGVCRAGILNQTRFMDLTKYMSAETNYFPWHVALSAFGYFNGLFGNTPNYGIFRVSIICSIIRFIRVPVL